MRRDHGATGGDQMSKRGRGASSKKAALLAEGQEIGAVEVGRVDLVLNEAQASGIEQGRDAVAEVDREQQDQQEREQVVFVLTGATSCTFLGLGISVMRDEEVRVSDPEAIRKFRASGLFAER